MSPSIWSLLFSFEGRTRRSTWWAATIVTGLLLVLCFVFIKTMVSANATLLLYPPFFWALAALAVKRLHDIGRSALALICLLVPILGPLWLGFSLACRRGTKGENQYGPDPFDIHFEYLQVDIQR